MPALFLILIIPVDPLLSSTRNAFKEHTGPAIFLPLWLKILLWLPSSLGIMDKLCQPTRACLVFEHICLVTETLFLGLVFSRISSLFLGPVHQVICLQQRLLALQATHIILQLPIRVPASLRGLPAPAAVDTRILGSRFQHQQLIPPAAARGWQLSTLSCQLSVGIP